MIRRGGFLMVLVLLLLSLWLIFGLAFLSRSSSQYRAHRAQLASVQARAIAMAGLEQVRAKLDKDPSFPPRGAEDQKVFAYQEEILEPDGTTRAGSVRVVIDRTYGDPPFQVLKIRCTGLVGPRGAPTARRTLEAEWDLAPDLRGRELRDSNRIRILDLGSL